MGRPYPEPERVAGMAIPNTRNTPEYTAFRKLQVYEAAVAGALPGGISQKERALLNRLRDTLGISAVDAETLERELQAKDTPAVALPASSRRYGLDVAIISDSANSTITVSPTASFDRSTFLCAFMVLVVPSPNWNVT